jgi:hypothetical protein
LQPATGASRGSSGDCTLELTRNISPADFRGRISCSPLRRNSEPAGGGIDRRATPFPFPSRKRVRPKGPRRIGVRGDPNYPIGWLICLAGLKRDMTNGQTSGRAPDQPLSRREQGMTWHRWVSRRGGGESLPLNDDGDPRIPSGRAGRRRRLSMEIGMTLCIVQWPVGTMVL